MRSLHDVYGMNAYRAGHVCLSVWPHDSTRERLDGFGWNLVWTLCLWGVPKIVKFPVIGNANMADELVGWDRH
jgi:hypothetical protein